MLLFLNHNVSIFDPIQTMQARQNKQCKAICFPAHSPHPLFPSSVCTEMTGEVHICSLQVVVGVQIEAMIYDMCCKQSLCISQGPVTAPAQAVKGSVIHSLILHLGHNPTAKTGFTFRSLLIQENKRSPIPTAGLKMSFYQLYYLIFSCFLATPESRIFKCENE